MFGVVSKFSCVALFIRLVYPARIRESRKPLARIGILFESYGSKSKSPLVPPKRPGS
jgi:hypothetical protein